MLVALLLTIVATLTQGLEGTSPELHHVAAMRLDMVTNEQRGVALDAAALRAPAGVEVAPEDLQPQLLPARRLVQCPARIIPTTAPISFSLFFRRRCYSQRKPNRAQPGLNKADLRHV